MKLIGESLKIGGEIINLGNDREEISMEDLAHKMFNLFNFHPQKIENLPPTKGKL